MINKKMNQYKSIKLAINKINIKTLNKLQIILLMPTTPTIITLQSTYFITIDSLKENLEKIHCIY